MPLESQSSQQEAKVPITADAVPAISRQIATLEPGAAAALRRGPLTGPGTAAYWKLLAGYDSLGDQRERAWAKVLQAIAVLTPKGGDGKKETAHLPSKPMGATLSDAGVSELRVARLLSQPRDRRGDAVVRICRRLAGTEHCRFNLRTLASFVVDASEQTDRRIARDYYRAVARREFKEKEDTTNG